MEERKIRVAITHGDTNGIGYELIFKTFSTPEMLEICTPIIYGSPKVAAYHRKAINTEVAFSIINSIDEVRDGRINLMTCFDEDVKVDLGTPSEDAEQAGVKALIKAIEDQKAGYFDGLVLAPLAKNSELQKRGLTVLLNESLRVGLATPSMELKEVALQVTKENIVKKAEFLFSMLKRDFLITNPRVAILALNPNGDGIEEKEAIHPAIEELVAAGKQAFGPYAADDFFGSSKIESFDAVLAMYHDQGVAPFKALVAGSYVVYTAGLPVACATSSDGVGYEQAGRGEADESSFRHAIYSVIDTCRNRQFYDEPLANPLPKLYHEKRDESEKTRFSVPKK